MEGTLISAAFPCKGFEMRKTKVSSRIHASFGERRGFCDHYSVLGVKKNASKVEIKLAYRKLARLYHPDVCKDGESEHRFKQINRAYESIIKDYRCFEPESGYVTDIEDLFETENPEMHLDCFFDGEWLEGVGINDPFKHDYHHWSPLELDQSSEELGTEWLNF